MTLHVAPPVALAVVSWNTRELLASCLESVEPEVREGRVEAWVVDNASSDGSAELVRERYGWVKLIAADENLGFGAAVNLVAARTRSEWIAASNADIELTPGALEALLDIGARDPAAGAVAPRLVRADGSIQQSVHSFPTVGSTALVAAGAHRLSDRLADRMCIEGRWDSNRPRRVDWAVGAFILIRRSAWEQVHGFDSRQWLYAEDLDLGWRLTRAGWLTRYEPSAVVRHHGEAATSQAWGEQTTDRWMESTYRWLRLRRGRTRARVIAAINVSGAAARWALLTPAALLRRSGREDRARMARWARLHWDSGLRRASSQRASSSR
jgi:GT2 family glycosyltransferase